MNVFLAAILAMSISSDEIGRFMHLPSWIPTSVIETNTFGSSEHSNSSHRVTADTLAAIESVFEAYYERAFFASEGRSNDWDVAIYGPRPTDLQRLWVTNAHSFGASKAFEYDSWDDMWPRAAPDSRRLVEYDNITHLPRYISLMLNTAEPGAPLIDKGDSWGRNRIVMFGSTWGPTNNVEIGSEWKDKRDFEPELSLSEVPLCYCKTDTVFVTKSRSGNGLMWEFLKELDSNFNALYHDRTDILARWEETQEWTNSLAAQTSVPDIIKRHFPLSNPETGLTNYTHRLVPDDYARPPQLVPEWELISEDKVSFSYSTEADPSSGRLLARLPTYEPPQSVMADVYRVYVFGDANIEAGFASLPFEIYLENPFDSSGMLRTVRNSDGAMSMRIKLPEGTAKVEVTEIDKGNPVFEFVLEGGGWMAYSYIPRALSGVFSATVKSYREVLATNAVPESSILATESRVLAMLDRTYEKPECVLQANIPETPAERDTTIDLRASLRASGSTRINVMIEYPYTSLQYPLALEDIITPESQEVKYFTTNIYSQISHPDVVVRRLFGVDESTSGDFSLVNSEVVGRSEWYIVEDLKKALADRYWQIWEDFTTNTAIVSVISYMDGLSRGFVTITTEFEEFRDPIYSFNPEGLIPEGPVELTVDGNVNIYRNAKIFVGGIPSERTFDKMYPWYGPGAFGWARGVVGRSRVMFACEIMKFISNRGWDMGKHEIEWSQNDPVIISDIYGGGLYDESKFTWDSRHRIRYSPNSSGFGEGLHVLIHKETEESLAQQVNFMFGIQYGPELLVPVDLSMAITENSYLIGFSPIIAGDEIEGLSFSMSGPTFEDVSVFLNGIQLSDSDQIVPFRLVGLEPNMSEQPYLNPSERLMPIAVDGRLLPVIITDWKWKALKSQDNKSYR